MGPLRLTLKRKVLPVELEGEDGAVKNYLLKGMSGRERDGYLNDMGDRIKLGPDGKPSGLKSFEGVQANLVARCLYTAEGAKVPQETIQDFPAETLNKLFETAQKLNGLDKDAEEAAKNG